MRIFLLGFMGSGKSSLARELAHKLTYSFIDLDNLVEERSGKKIAEIFENDGEVVFRKIEHDCLLETFSHKNIVIATGGGTPCFFNNIDLINQNGISVYLKFNPGILASRLSNDKGKRPLIKHFENKKDFQDHIETLFSEEKNFICDPN